MLSLCNTCELVYKMVDMMYACAYLHFVTIQTCISYFAMEDVSRNLYLMDLILSTSQYSMEVSWTR